jgi:hypothetical protein
MMKAIFKVVLAGSIVVMVVANAMHTNPAVKRPAAKKVSERPWLSPEAEDQMFGPGGRPGPRLDDVGLGGSPSSRVRTTSTFGSTSPRASSRPCTSW